MKNFMKWYRRRRLRKMVEIAIKVLRTLDYTMIKAGYSRQQRREVWRNLAKSREAAIKYLERTLAAWIISLLLLSGMAEAEPVPIYKVIIAEAVSEGYQGMYAVACVIKNRGGNLRGFIGAKRPDLDNFVKRQRPEFIRMAKEIQKEVFERNGPDITKGATHFENIRRFGMPSWAKEMIVTCKIKRHTFFKKK